MPDIFCNKVKTGIGYALAPAHEQDLEEMKKLPKDQPLRVTMRRIRNVDHHRKYFALLNYAFDCWEPPENHVGEKNFERFRKDIVILAGFYERYVRLNGETRIEAKSISFANMDQDEFDLLYQKTIDAILKYVLTNYTQDDLEAVVSQVMEFS